MSEKEVPTQRWWTTPYITGTGELWTLLGTSDKPQPPMTEIKGLED